MKIDPELKIELKKTLMNEINKKRDDIIIESSIPLSNEQISMLLEKYPKFKNKNIKFVLNRKIIAGIIIKQGSTIIDLSLLTQFNQIKKNLYEIT